MTASRKPPISASEKMITSSHGQNACHDTYVQTLGNTTGGLNHREGGFGVQLAVELACVVGHFGSKTAQPASCKEF